jgi:type VI secretion system secreted protein VgrG
MATFTQTRRLLTVSSPLGQDVLLLTGFTGREEMSRLFRFQLEFLSENEAIDPGDLVGNQLTWAVNQVDDQPRYFNGYVSRFAAGRKTGRGLRAYRADVVPWLWFLTQTADCKIFQNKNAVEIIKAVFEDLGFSDYKISVTRQLRTREYCVQYRETAFNFVSRLMEEEGIFYFFNHEDGSHTLVLADAKTAYVDCKEGGVEYTGGSLARNHISSWEHQYQFHPGKWTQTDYNFETPRTSLMTSTDTLVDLHDPASYEMFDYPGLYYKKSDGQPLTTLRIEQEETPRDVVTGASTCCTFSTGSKFKLTWHDCPEEEDSYALTSVQHSASDASYQMNGAGSGYRNTFTCIPATVPFRPARVTPKPFVQGPQTAVVVGPKGEEVFTDKYGRIKVQFFWDRKGAQDENSSVWMRVAQISAGKRWGASFWPRIGQEVVVDFLEGDPDRPLITGSVYNAEQMPPYQGSGLDPKHPHDAKLSGIKTCSTPGGSGFNEIRFDDTKGKEELFLRAENTMDVRVGGDQHVSVGHQRHLIVKADSYQDFKASKLTKVTGTEELTVDANQRLSVGTTRDVHVHGKQTEKFADLFTTAEGTINMRAGGKFYLDTDGALTLTSAQHKIGTGEYAILGQKGVLAFDQLCLTCGGSFITIKDDGIWISAPFVHINSGGAALAAPEVGASKPPAPTDPSEFDAVAADDSRSGFPSAADAKIAPPRPQPSPTPKPSSAPQASNGPAQEPGPKDPG